jgi:hypothetical protein
MPSATYFLLIRREKVQKKQTFYFLYESPVSSELMLGVQPLLEKRGLRPRVGKKLLIIKNFERYQISPLSIKPQVMGLAINTEVTEFFNLTVFGRRHDVMTGCPFFFIIIL